MRVVDRINWSYDQWLRSGSQQAVLTCYAFHANSRTHMAYPSMRTVAKETGFDYATVKRAVQALVNQGYLLPYGKRWNKTTQYRIPFETPIVLRGQSQT